MRTARAMLQTQRPLGERLLCRSWMSSGQAGQGEARGKGRGAPCHKGTSGSRWQGSTVLHCHEALDPRGPVPQVAHSDLVIACAERSAACFAHTTEEASSADLSAALLDRNGEGKAKLLLSCLQHRGTYLCRLVCCPASRWLRWPGQAAACLACTAGEAALQTSCCPSFCRCPCSCKRASRLRMDASYCMPLTLASTRRRWGRS